MLIRSKEEIVFWIETRGEIEKSQILFQSLIVASITGGMFSPSNFIRATPPSTNHLILIGGRRWFCPRQLQTLEEYLQMM